MPRAPRLSTNQAIETSRPPSGGEYDRRVVRNTPASFTRIDMTRCATVSLGEAALVLGVHRSTAWSLYRRNEFPVPVLRIGSSLRVVKAHLETYLSTGVPVEPPLRDEGAG